MTFELLVLELSIITMCSLLIFCLIEFDIANNSISALFLDFQVERSVYLCMPRQISFISLSHYRRGKSHYRGTWFTQIYRGYAMTLHQAVVTRCAIATWPFWVVKVFSSWVAYLVSSSLTCHIFRVLSGAGEKCQG